MKKIVFATLLAATALAFTGNAYAEGSRKSMDSRERAESSVIRYSSIEPAAGDPKGVKNLDRNQVRSLQDALYRHGYMPGPADGILGYKTSAAIREFQKDAGLPVTGMATNETLMKLGFNAAPSGKSPQSEPMMNMERNQGEGDYDRRRIEEEYSR